MSVVSLNSNEMLDSDLSSGNERDNLKKIICIIILLIIILIVMFCFALRLILVLNVNANLMFKKRLVKCRLLRLVCIEMSETKSTLCMSQML
jgi:Mn2+/Fe2+ NRAMP family transporter